MGTEARIILWWVLFGGTHILGSSVRVRGALVRTIGLAPFKGLYSLVSLATFIPLCLAFASGKHSGPLLYPASSGPHYTAQAIVLLAFVVLMQGLFTPSPQTTMAELSGNYADRARGIQRITRHPINLAFALYGAAHCLALPWRGDWLFFGGFVVFAVASAVHQDARTRALGPEPVRAYLSCTSMIPFAAIAAGRQRLAPREFSLPALLVAVVLFVLLRAFHGRLFGGFAG